MTTTARPYRRAVRPKSPRVFLKSQENLSRSTQRNAEARRIRNAERALEQSPVGREVLRLMDERIKALFKEQLAGLGLVTAQQDADLCRKQHSRVCRQSRYAEYESAWMKLQDAESDLRVWQKRHAAYVHARDLVDAELSLLAEAAR